MFLLWDATGYIRHAFFGILFLVWLPDYRCMERGCTSQVSGYNVNFHLRPVDFKSL